MLKRDHYIALLCKNGRILETFGLFTLFPVKIKVCVLGQFCGHQTIEQEEAFLLGVDLGTESY